MQTPHNRIALVTGAGSGIGRAVALALLRDGWRVVHSGRRLEPLHDTIRLAGNPFDDIEARAMAAPTDVTRPDAVRTLFDMVRARYGRLDLLFHGVGCGTPPAAGVDTLSPEAWRQALDQGATGAFLCLQQALRAMRHQRPGGGRVLLRGAAPGLAPSEPLAAAGVAAMAAAQAVAGLVQSCAEQARADGVALGLLDCGGLAGGAVSAADVAELVRALAALPPAAGMAQLALRPLAPATR